MLDCSCDVDFSVARDGVKSGCESSSLSFCDPLSGSACVLDWLVVLVNMSRMLCRRSNSGMSFPQAGNMSLVDHGRVLTPRSKTPGGFMWSRMNAFPPSISTWSASTAYAGQWSEPWFCQLYSLYPMDSLNSP